MFDVLMTHVVLAYFLIVGLLAAIFWYFGIGVDYFYITTTYVTYFFVIFVVILILIQ